MLGGPQNLACTSEAKRHSTMAKNKTRTTRTDLTERQFRDVSKALSDARRYEILQLIAATETCSCQKLRKEFPISAATLSHHLKELESAGLISITREGKFAFPTFRREVWASYLARLTEL